MDADPVIARILESSVWHILYPFKEKEKCFVLDEETWNELIIRDHWEERFEEQAPLIQWIFDALGQDVYAEDCPFKPYRRDIKYVVLEIPEMGKVRDWAEKIGKFIIMHRLEGNSYNGYNLRELYRVGRRDP